MLEDLNGYKQSLQTAADTQSARRSVLQLQRALITMQQIGDEKLQIVQNIHDLIENKSRQLDADVKSLGMLFYYISSFDFSPYPFYYQIKILSPDLEGQG